MTEPYRGGCITLWRLPRRLKSPLQCQYSDDNGRVSMALGKDSEDVVDGSMSDRLLDLDCRKIRVGREEGRMVAVRRMGATSSDADSVSPVCP